MGDFPIKRNKKESNDDKKIKSSIDFFEKCGIIIVWVKIAHIIYHGFNIFAEKRMKMSRKMGQSTFIFAKTVVS